MTNKELNMAILSKLYEIAEMIWQKMVRNDHGCFRASEIAKNMGKIFYWGDADKDQSFQIEVGSFRCEFAAAHIFRLITKFESLAGIGKNAHQFVYQDENGKEKSYVFFQATKEMAELCDFVYKKQDKKAVTSIFIDAEKNDWWLLIPTSCWLCLLPSLRNREIPAKCLSMRRPGRRCAQR